MRFSADRYFALTADLSERKYITRFQSGYFSNISTIYTCCMKCHSNSIRSKYYATSVCQGSFRTIPDNGGLCLRVAASIRNTRTMR
jgi:hypothetical protein